jgi:hypothetical protein
MTYLILMLAVAAAVVLWRKALGRGLVEAIGAIDWKWAVILAILMVAAWGIVHHVQAPIAITGDPVAGLFDTFTYGDLLITYGDLLVGVAVAVMNRQMRQLLDRAADLTRLLIHSTMRRAARARRAPARPRRRPPDRDEPEPAGWGGVLAFA